MSCSPVSTWIASRASITVICYSCIPSILVRGGLIVLLNSTFHFRLGADGDASSFFFIVERKNHQQYCLLGCFLLSVSIVSGHWHHHLCRPPMHMCGELLMNASHIIHYTNPDLHCITHTLFLIFFLSVTFIFESFVNLKNNYYLFPNSKLDMTDCSICFSYI